MLLKLTAAFDTIDHGILAVRLEQAAGIQRTALKWFRSFLSNRSFSVISGQAFSSSSPLICGVPQRSILAPILFPLYILPLGTIYKCKYGISNHFYADDTQIYLTLRKKHINALDSLVNCLKEVKCLYCLWCFIWCFVIVVFYLLNNFYDYTALWSTLCCFNSALYMNKWN